MCVKNNRTYKRSVRSGDLGPPEFKRRLVFQNFDFLGPTVERNLGSPEFKRRPFFSPGAPGIQTASQV